MTEPVSADPAAEDSGESGAAVVDFVLVSVLVTALAMALLQLSFALHVRNTLTWAASEGARAGARLGASPQIAQDRSRELIRQSLSSAYAQDVQVSRRVEGGVAVVEVHVCAPLPVVALWGPPGAVTTRGRAFAEDQ
ncbi:hypothetical protein KEM60_03160 [Austwickia sp. TVS 96-490-7B]|uniref:TadE/TadG family type IV pilus assembly protein n=1 Tax=Austwickia sp. TVS 96-490-7B TaxID=2830843 RepID=UPI001C59C33F|nr:TadE family protein [Austwickia sp. TVS 96-490-7B]MBW3086931.1 hypothetical protein [Austwickia sp. TVS 96-490-7B]